MTDADTIARGSRLRSVRDLPGWTDVVAYCDDISTEGWETFIDLPVEQKTGKKAQYYQSQSRVLKEFLRWFDRCISESEQMEAEQRRRQ